MREWLVVTTIHVRLALPTLILSILENGIFVGPVGVEV
jgi:hypothetical protein